MDSPITQLERYMDRWKYINASAPRVGPACDCWMRTIPGEIVRHGADCSARPPLDPLVHSARWIERAKAVLLYPDGTEGHSLMPDGAHYCACEWDGMKWVNPNDSRLPRPQFPSFSQPEKEEP